ncbi:aldehyde dehydrogenase family protein [Nonomuraea sp. M3C6]|uniref:Aldehyde dehydrogenase family protein n=1 Tax=Nonomuraea marmarensis TaxID=3351344 RepID=A0ABW7AMG9_9ACTN
MSEQRAAQHWIDGAEAAGGGCERIEVVNPATATVIADLPAGTAADVDRAVAAAQRAFPEWSAVPVSERAAAIARIADGITDAIDDFAATVTSEMGSPISYAKVVQAGLPYQVASSFAALADGYAWEEELGNRLIVREPIGVVGAITPWNAPLYQTVAKDAPALLAGCTVVLKPSVVTPLTAALFAELTAAAGIPAGAFNVVYGAGSVVGEAISGHQGIDMVSFTGSTGAGKRVSISAAGTVKRVALELGGKSANVILDDADMQNAVNLGLEYAWMNGGQTCAAWTRMLVPASRHDEIVELAVAAAGSYGVGDPTDPATRIGPMSSVAQQGRVSGYNLLTADGFRVGIVQHATFSLAGDVGPPDGSSTPRTVPPCRRALLRRSRRLRGWHPRRRGAGGVHRRVRPGPGRFGEHAHRRPAARRVMQ